MRMHFASGGAAMFRQGIFGTMPCSRHRKSDSKHSRTRPSKLALCNTCNILQRYKSLYRVASPPKLLGEAAGRASEAGDFVALRQSEVSTSGAGGDVEKRTGLSEAEGSRA